MLAGVLQDSRKIPMEVLEMQKVGRWMWSLGSRARLLGDKQCCSFDDPALLGELYRCNIRRCAQHLLLQRRTISALTDWLLAEFTLEMFIKN